MVKNEQSIPSREGAKKERSKFSAFMRSLFGNNASDIRCNVILYLITLIFLAVLSDDGAEGVVGAGFTAGDEAELRAGRGAGCGRAGFGRSRGFRAAAAGGKREQHENCKQQCDQFFHEYSSCVCAGRTAFFFWHLLYRMRLHFARAKKVNFEKNIPAKFKKL